MTNTSPQYVFQTWPTVRQWERVQLNVPVTISVDSTNYHGWCVDICQGGLGFTCAAPLAPGQEIKIRVSFDTLGEVQARAFVRHSNAFRGGCEFLFISPDQQRTIELYMASQARKVRR
jgi:hypothetical protein